MSFAELDAALRWAAQEIHDLAPSLPRPAGEELETARQRVLDAIFYLDLARLTTACALGPAPREAGQRARPWPLGQPDGPTSV